VIEKPSLAHSNGGPGQSANAGAHGWVRGGLTVTDLDWPVPTLLVFSHFSPNNAVEHQHGRRQGDPFQNRPLEFKCQFHEFFSLELSIILEGANQFN
jgi:hypothetical protein